jgi:nucleotide-binding universal stress UspA family protein
MNILLGVDGSDHGFAAVEFVGRLADPGFHKIGLVHSCGPVALNTSDISNELVDRAQKAVAQVIFDEAINRLPEALRGSVQTFTGTDRPAELLLKVAQEWPANVVAVGARGLSSLETLLLGSVSSEIVRQATTPVLVIRNQPAATGLKVLVAYAADNAEATARAINNIRWPSATVGQVVHVTEPYNVPGLPDWVKNRARDADTEAWSQVWVKEHEQEVAQVKQNLQAYAAKLPGCFSKSEPVVLEGNAAEAILEYITKSPVDIVIVGKQAKGMLDWLILGSTSERILNYAPCSVLILPTTTK